MRKTTEYIEYDDFELEVDCYYIPPERQTYDNPGNDGYYEIDAVFYKKVDITEVLEEFVSNWHDKLSDKLLNN